MGILPCSIASAVWFDWLDGCSGSMQNDSASEEKRSQGCERGSSLPSVRPRKIDLLPWLRHCKSATSYSDAGESREH